MKNLFLKSDQRGTLLIEALAMLGLIAMVTPTLYKKSAERLQEIQDINSASQARTMGNVMDAFIRQNFSGLMSSTADERTMEINFEDNKSGYYYVGYSSYLPYGYQPDQIRGFDMPKVYVHREGSTLVSYVLYPKIVDVGNKRAARLASLIGANGGVITDKKEAKGSGGAWFLDSTMVEDMNLDESSLTENSIMITSNEPVAMSYDDSAKYLYRVPPQPDDVDQSYFHNTMVTDLYMGGHGGYEVGDYAGYASDYYSIFNVKKLTMNTNCDRDYISGHDSSRQYCDPKVADLYIGKPFDMTLSSYSDHSPEVGPNNGAAWIYGNMAALNENFQLFREDTLGNGYVRNSDGYNADMDRVSDGWDVLQFARMNSSGSDDTDIVVLRAENKEGAERVAMLNDFVQIVRDSSKSNFWVGESSGIGGRGALIDAYSEDGTNWVKINQNSNSSVTEINRQGGTVYINGGSSHSERMNTYINDMGGNLYAGYEAGWLRAEGYGSSSKVHILANQSGSSAGDVRVFTVGHNVNQDGVVSDAYNTNHMIYADVEKVSLRGGNIRSYTNEGYTGTEAPTNSLIPSDTVIADEYTSLRNGTLKGLTTVASRYTDIIGSTYMGNKNMSSTTSDDGRYSRNDFTLGVAGSAWIDDLLWARKAWLKQAGMQELHAGFENFKQFSSYPESAWLNAYDDGVVIRNRDKIAGGSSRGEVFANNSDVMFYTNSSLAYIGDAEGAWAAFENGSARIGAGLQTSGELKNYFLADMKGGDGSANVVGSTLANIYTSTDRVSSVVDIQREAMRFGGHWSSSYANRIDAKTGTFTIKTKNVSSSDVDEGAQFYADADMVRTRWVDFQVEDDSSLARFRVAPNAIEDSKTDEANVQVNGSFHVTGNEVIHIASNSSNAVGTTDNDHAMFEIDPEYIQVWARDKDGNYAAGGSSAGGYYAMLKINPTDINGGSSDIDDTRDASIYIRKGAIELEESSSNGSSSTYAADEGFGYIKANRLVSNTNLVVPPTHNLVSGKTNKSDRGTQYDQYMVNPAYTSVMHDIKLTTRGGARLSDILPDFVLKGVYNVSNDFLEGSKTDRISWSCGPNCSDQGYNPVASDVAWADPYIGRIPYAICPPGYRNMATLIPVSFNMGQAGDIIPSKSMSGMPNQAKGHWYVQPAPRYNQILANAVTIAEGTHANLDDVIIYPSMQEVSSMIYNSINTGTSGTWLPGVSARTEGWFLGLPALHTTPDGMVTDSKLFGSTGVDKGDNSYTYTYDGSDRYAVALPLYFQQNTWLKTSLEPYEEGWHGRIGFLYDLDYYSDKLATSTNGEGIFSNNNQDGFNDNTNTNPGLSGNYAWNLFPVPTNTIEGHATVYCYFDRSEFKNGNWNGLVDQVDQLGDYRPIDKRAEGEYKDRLNDPSLKYNDPW